MEEHPWTFVKSLERPPPEPASFSQASERPLQTLDPKVIRVFHEAINQDPEVLIVPHAWASGSQLAGFDFRQSFEMDVRRVDPQVKPPPSQINFLTKWGIWPYKEPPHVADIGANKWQRLDFPVWTFPDATIAREFPSYQGFSSKTGLYEQLDLFLHQTETVFKRITHFEDASGYHMSLKYLRSLEKYGSRAEGLPMRDLCSSLIERYTHEFSDLEKRLYQFIIMIQLDFVRYQRYPQSYGNLLGSLGIFWQSERGTKGHDSLLQNHGTLATHAPATTRIDTKLLYAHAMAAVLGACDDYLTAMRSFTIDRLRSNRELIGTIFSGVIGEPNDLRADKVLRSLNTPRATSGAHLQVLGLTAKESDEAGDGHRELMSDEQNTAETANIHEPIEVRKSQLSRKLTKLPARLEAATPRAERSSQKSQAKAMAEATLPIRETRPEPVKAKPAKRRRGKSKLASVVVLGSKRQRFRSPPLQEEPQRKRAKLDPTLGALPGPHQVYMKSLREAHSAHNKEYHGKIDRRNVDDRFSIL